jgi:hypothetical protein
MVGSVSAGWRRCVSSISMDSLMKCQDLAHQSARFPSSDDLPPGSDDLFFCFTFVSRDSVSSDPVVGW